MLDQIGVWLTAYGIRGGGRLTRWASRRQPMPFVTKNVLDGLQLYLDPRSEIDVQIIKQGTHEPQTLARLLSLTDDASVFWDIGANIGFHSFAVQRARSKSQVYAFEASPIVFSQLLLNRNRNRSSVNLICVGLASERGFGRFSIRDFGSSSHSSFSPWAGVDYKINIVIPCDTGDNIIRDAIAPSPTIIKIDVEGYELSVLKGLSAALQSPQLRHIIFEGDNDIMTQRPLPPVPEMLVSAGFQIELIDAGEHNHLASR